MNYTTATQFDTLRQQGETIPEAALNLFDELDGVSIPFMMGRWIGSGFPTHYPMDGLLEATGWYGKEFLNADEVHPLLHDMFRKVDTNTVLGLMDYKGVDSPFFFILKRELDQATPSEASAPNARTFNPAMSCRN